MGLLDELSKMQSAGLLEPQRPPMQINPMAATQGLGGILGGGSLFHGSPQTNLSTLTPGPRGPFGPAVYASPVQGVAARYAGELGRTYAIKNADGEIFHGLGSSYLPSGVNAYDLWKTQTQKLMDAAPPELKRPIGETAIKLLPQDGYALFGNISRMLGSKEAAQALFQKAGFAGVSGHVDGPEVALFNNQQVAQ